jgi:hypothetical protein
MFVARIRSTRTLTKLLIAASLAVPVALFAPAVAQAQLIISVGIAPPLLPVYAQPEIPGYGYIWVPGYWAYGPEGYFWVPGTWVLPPQDDYLWTPAYWDFDAGFYRFHRGYWGPHIGYYGGINYGFGYFGTGYEGGYWRDRHFYYNSQVNRLRPGIQYVYDRPVQQAAYNRVSYNGGQGGVTYRPGPQELVAQREHHVDATRDQVQHQTLASQDRQQFARNNGGRPAVTAAPTPGAFHGNGGAPAATGGRPGNPAINTQPAQPNGSMNGRQGQGGRNGSPVVTQPAQPGISGGQNVPAERRGQQQPQRSAVPEGQVPQRQAQPQQRQADQQQVVNQRQAQQQQRQAQQPQAQPQRQAPPPQEMRQAPQPQRQAPPPQQMQQRQAPPPQAQPQRQAPPPQAAPQGRPAPQAAPQAEGGHEKHGGR